MKNDEKKTITTNTEKARLLMGYKRYVEKRKLGYTHAQCKYIDYQCYLLTIIAENPQITIMQLPENTHVICKKLPTDNKYNLEIGQEYTVVDSFLGEADHGITLKGIDYDHHQSCCFEIAERDRLTPEQALELYGKSFELDYAEAAEYNAECDKKYAEEQRRKKVMRKKFRKSDLHLGDIIIAENGFVGIVIPEKNCIILNGGGYIDLEDYDDFLVSEFEEDETVSKVYRSIDGFNSILTFTSYEDDSEIVFDRSVVCPENGTGEARN